MFGCGWGFDPTFIILVPALIFAAYKRLIKNNIKVKECTIIMLHSFDININNSFYKRWSVFNGKN